MFSHVIITPYRGVSGGAAALRDTLRDRGHFANIRKIVWSNIDPGFYRDTLFLNWGTQTNAMSLWNNNPRFASRNNRIINPSILSMSNKVSFLQRCVAHGTLAYFIPHFWTDPNTAHRWLHDVAGRKLCARTLTSASGGRGLFVIGPNDTWVTAPLYVEYIPKKQEYRAHFFRGSDSIIYQQKRLRSGTENPNFEIRNLDHNWVFCRENVNPPNSVRRAAENFRNYCLTNDQLDFGAVDIIFQERSESAWILEVNTAPGLEGTTLTDYCQFIENYSDNYNNATL